mgnify:CR=1 FL=1
MVTAGVMDRIQELRRALQLAEPSAFLVEPRVIRRVIRERHGFVKLSTAIPHTESQIVPSVELRELAHPDELGLADFLQLPEICLLISQPAEDELQHWPVQELLQQVWRTSTALETRTVDMHVSRIRRKLQLLPENGFTLEEVHQLTKIDRWFLVQIEQIVQRALAELDEDQRTLVVLRDIENMSYEEIQSITGLPEGTVKSRIRSGLTRLRTALIESGVVGSDA